MHTQRPKPKISSQNNGRLIMDPANDDNNVNNDEEETLNNNTVLLLKRYEQNISTSPPLRRTDAEIVFRAIDTSSSSDESVGQTVTTIRPVVMLRLLSDQSRFVSEIHSRRGLTHDGSSSSVHDTEEEVESPYVVDVVAAYRDDDDGAGWVEVEARADLPSDVRTLLSRWDRNDEEDEDKDTDDDEGEMGGDDITTAEEDDSEMNREEGGEEGGSEGDFAMSSPVSTYPYLLVLRDHGSTLDESLERSSLLWSSTDLRLARGVIADVVVGLMQLHTVGRVHRNLTPRCIVRSLTAENSKEQKKWQISELGSCGEDGEVLKQSEVGSRCPDWGFLPPEAAKAILAAETEGQGDSSDKVCDVETTPAWDLWSLGCVLYRLVFGSDVWKASRDGRISEEDLHRLANWSTSTMWNRATKVFPKGGTITEEQRAAVDLVSKLLAPTPQDRMRNFEFGIVSVHQHEFIEGKPLEPQSLRAFQARERLVKSERQDLDRFHTLTSTLGLDERWELKRAMDVLLLGAFEPVDVNHIPTSFVILQQPLASSSPEEDGTDKAELCLDEGMKWLSLMEEVSPLVKKTLLQRDVRSIGQFWSKISTLFDFGKQHNGGYCYFYFVDDLTGEPILSSPTTTDAIATTYPIPIKTRSDILPKLLPLLHITMRSAALYSGAAGLARLFGAGPNPILTDAKRTSCQNQINDLKDENGRLAQYPFGSFVDDIERVRGGGKREQFLHGDDDDAVTATAMAAATNMTTNVRSRALTELVKFLEQRGVIVTINRDDNNESNNNSGSDFVGLHRLVDDTSDGRAIWTVLNDAPTVKTAIQSRKAERLKEEQCLWEDRQTMARVLELEGDVKGAKSELGRVEGMAKRELDRAEAGEKRVAELEEMLEQTRKELSEAKVQLKGLKQSEARAMSMVTNLGFKLFGS